MEEKKIVKPIVLKYEDGVEFTLEFNRTTAAKAEDDGFNIMDVQEKMQNRVPQLFYWAFKMHHPTMKRDRTDEILYNDLGGITEDILDRLVELYSVPFNELINDGGQPKNSKLTVNL